MGLMEGQSLELAASGGLHLQTDRAGSSPQETVGPARALRRRPDSLLAVGTRGRQGQRDNAPLWELTVLLPC